MFIRPCYKKSNGKKLAYWAREQLCCDQHLAESYRTAKGPRQRIVAYLGQLKAGTRRGIKQIAEEKNTSQGNGTQKGKDKPQFVQARLFNDDSLYDDQPSNKQLNDNPLEAEWVEINANGIRVENEKAFGGPWLALQLVKLLGLDEFLTQHLPSGEEQVPWSLVSLILVICRLLNPSSELFTITNGVIPKARPFTWMGKRTSARHCAEFFNRLGSMAHFGLLFGVCTLDNLGPHGEMFGLGRRTASRVRRTEQDQPGGRCAADISGRGDSQTLHHPPDRTPGNPAPTPRSESAASIQKIIFNQM